MASDADSNRALTSYHFLLAIQCPSDVGPILSPEGLALFAFLDPLRYLPQWVDPLQTVVRRDGLASALGK